MVNNPISHIIPTIGNKNNTCISPVKTIIMGEKIIPIPRNKCKKPLFAKVSSFSILISF
jgi:hypothetical protein